jgi:membrane protein YqaA with SNARE-associated domain
LPSHADLKTEVIILQRDVEKLEKTKEEWARRFWAILGPILGAIAGWALGYFSRR